MALLSEKGREKRFKALGLEYNKEGIKALQKRYLRKKDVDGIYGVDTDNLLRHVYNVKTYTKNFRPEEFKCECGGRYCTGYPSYMKKVELQNLQSIRDHWKKPMTVTCGLRCRPYNNSLAGSIPNSLHLTGYACDFNMDGVTESTAQRKAAIKWIKKLPNHHYTYGHGYNSYGASISAPYMGIGNGAAIHTDTSKPKAVVTATAKKPTKTTKQDKIVALLKVSIDGAVLQFLHIGKMFYVYDANGLERYKAVNNYANARKLESLLGFNLTFTDNKEGRTRMPMEFMFMAWIRMSRV